MDMPHLKQVLLFPYEIDKVKAELIPPEKLALNYPACWEYLLQNKKALENREEGKMNHEEMVCLRLS